MNRYRKYFNENMTERELLATFFALATGLSKDERKELSAACNPVHSAIIRRSFKEADKKNLMSSI